MTWQEIQKSFPHQWLLIEAIKAHTENDMRILEDMAVLNTYPDSKVAMDAYAEWHRKEPHREFLVLHTDRKKLDIHVRRWLGIRGVPCKSE